MIILLRAHLATCHRVNRKEVDLKNRLEVVTTTYLKYGSVSSREPQSTFDAIHDPATKMVMVYRAS